jgi:multidrug efflux pump subunit AcrA (membrane-fusion protein)
LRRFVKTGDLLFELDPAEANADARSAADALNASLAEIARRRYAIEAVRAAQEEESRMSGDREAASPVERLAGQPDTKIAWDESLPEPFRLREEAVLRADLVQLADALSKPSAIAWAAPDEEGYPSAAAVAAGPRLMQINCGLYIETCATERARTKYRGEQAKD